MDKVNVFQMFFFALITFGLIWFANTPVFGNIFEKNAFNLTLILLWICLGSAITGLMFNFSNGMGFWDYFNSFQTIIQTVAILIIFITLLSPFGFVYDEYANYYAKSICLPKNTSLDIYPFGRQDFSSKISLENGNLIFTNITNATDVFPRFPCNGTSCYNSLSDRMIGYKNG